MARGIVFLLAVEATANSLRHLNVKQHEPETTPLPGDPDVHAEYDYQPLKNPATVAKYTDAESVSQVLFVMACKAKHKNDIDGKTRDASKESGLTEEDFQKYVKNLQDANIEQMKETCGKVNAKTEKECHEGCTSKWAAGGAFALTAEKAKCTAACTEKHTNWGKECESQVDNLQNVYIQEQGNLANTKKCQELHCPLFPATLMAKDDEGEKIKEDGCKEECTEKKIKAKCVKKWDMEVDFKMGAFENECQGSAKSEKLDPCMSDGTAKIDGDHTTCKEEGRGACDEKHQACMDEGAKAGPDSMVGAHAESICGTRKDNCYEGSDGRCMKKQKKELEENGKKCMKEFKEEKDKCIEDKLKEGRETFATECEEKDTPTCGDDCKEKCQIPDMRECQKDMIKKAFAVTQNYCTQLWDWIFASEQYDSKNMDPIPKSQGGGRFKSIAKRRA